jgi:hypothetical protein
MVVRLSDPCDLIERRGLINNIPVAHCFKGRPVEVGWAMFGWSVEQVAVAATFLSRGLLFDWQQETWRTIDVDDFS